MLKVGQHHIPVRIQMQLHGALLFSRGCNRDQLQPG